MKQKRKKKKMRVNVEMPAEMYDSLTRHASEDGRPRAAFIRRVLARELARLEATAQEN